jgi:hypothetical protein
MDLTFTTMVRLETISKRMGPFDIFAPHGPGPVSFSVKGSLRTLSPTGPDREAHLLNDDAREQDLSLTIPAIIAQVREYTYAEVLNMVYQQNRERLLSIAYDWLSANQVSLWSRNVPVVAAVHENGALLWPAFREIFQTDYIIPTGRPVEDPREASLLADLVEIHRRAVLKDIDFWMF